MKNIIIILAIFMLSAKGYSQNSGFEYHGRFNPFVNKEKLKEAKLVGDITSQLWSKLLLPYKERFKLDSMRRKEYSLGYYLFPQGGYEPLIKYISVEISTISNGKIQIAKSTSDNLTAEQKNILTTADQDTDIQLKIKFNYKNNEKIINNNLLEGKLTVTVVPETEAEYPGGFKELNDYLNNNIFNKISDIRKSEKLKNAIVKFTINEGGKLIDAVILRTSEDIKTDKLILEAMNKMPNWKPAKNEKGIKIKQEFKIPFGEEVGC